MSVYGVVITLLSAIGLILVIQLIAAIVKIKIRYKFYDDVVVNKVFNNRTFDYKKTFKEQLELQKYELINYFEWMNLIYVFSCWSAEEQKEFQRFFYLRKLNKMNLPDNYTGKFNGAYYYNGELVDKIWCGRIRENFKYEYVWKSQLLK